MAIQQPETPYLQIIRRALWLLLALPLLAGCGKDEAEQPVLESSADEIVLRNTAGSEATFTVTATGPWTLSTTGDGFDISPAEGTRGETTLTVTATRENPDTRRRTLGRVSLRLSSGAAETDVEIAQSPAVARRTVLMYLPWSGPSQPLTEYFRQNIADMESIVAEGYLQDERLLVFFMPTAKQAELFEVYHDNGTSLRHELKTYDEVPAFTTSEGIASILEEVKQFAPAEKYAMTIGCHGMAWLPAHPETYPTATAAPGAGTAAPEKEYWEYAAPGKILTRWFGGSSSSYQTDIPTLARGISAAGMKMDYILFDDCYMSSIEVAFELRKVTDHLIGSTSEIMAYGFPYARMGHYMFGEVDYAGICNAFYDFYMSYQFPYGTIGVTVCSRLDALAAVMQRINEKHTFDTSQLGDLQQLDGYSPVRFFDLGDYVRHLCTDQGLLSQFEEQLELTVPSAYRKHTPEYYSMSYGGTAYPIRTFSGVTTSDPSTSPSTNAKRQTAWWKATHKAE